MSKIEEYILPERDEFAFDKSERFLVNVTSPIPLYYQVEKVIVGRITQKDMVDRKLPSEAELMSMFGVGRATVRKAIDNLVNKGLIDRRRGILAKVARPQMTEDLTRISSFYHEMASRDLEVRTVVLRVLVHTPDQDVAAMLDLDEGEKTLSIQRIRGTNEAFPIGLMVTEIPASFGIDPNEDFAHRSLADIIQQDYGIPILRASVSVVASGASEEEAGYLEISTGDPVLVFERVSYTYDDRPLDYARVVYRSDRYSFYVDASR